MGKLQTYDDLKRDFQRNGRYPSVGIVKFSWQECQKHLEKAADKNFRKIAPRTMERYSDDLTEHRWELNCETVKFDTTGILADGQHRFSSAVRSRKPLITAAAYGVKEVRNVDTGYKRTLAQVLGNLGVHNPAETATGVKWIWGIRNDNRKPRRCLVSNRAAVEYMQGLKNINQWSSFIGVQKRHLRAAGLNVAAGMLIAIPYLAHGGRKPTQYCEEFFQAMTTGAGIYGWTLHARNLLTTEERYQHYSDILQYEKCVALIQGWNSWVMVKKQGQTRKNLLEVEGRNYPRILPVPAKYRDNFLKSTKPGGKLGAKVDKAHKPKTKRDVMVRDTTRPTKKKKATKKRVARKK